MTRGHLAHAGIVLAFQVCVGACSDPGDEVTDNGTPDGGPANTSCAAGLKAVGPVCVPIFDECGDDEVPLLGGGCRRVGVRECLDGKGIAGPPDWTCKPIGPPTKCLTGWKNGKDGWCEPILPSAKCPAGTMEVIGKDTCQPIGDCGTGTWGKIKTTASTIYVDGSYSGSSSDGSKTSPYTTITAALFAAKPGAHLAVAAGTYNENLNIKQKVTLEGRCAQKVTIKGTGKSVAVQVRLWADGTVIRGVTITSGNTGLGVDGLSVTAERVVVHGCTGVGIQVDPTVKQGKLTLRDSLVANNREAGIILNSSQATVER